MTDPTIYVWTRRLGSKRLTEPRIDRTHNAAASEAANAVADTRARLAATAAEETLSLLREIEDDLRTSILIL